MTKQSLIIYKIPALYKILNEIKENFKFDLYNFEKTDDFSEINELKFGNYLVLTKVQNKIKNEVNQLTLDELPSEISDIIEKINLKLLKQKYVDQSEIEVGKYKININSREISDKDQKMKLTEREIDIILFLKNSKYPQTIESLQKNVWGHNSNLETHTVETHIYRLRKKINNIFKNEKFIISTLDGYKISWKKEIL